LERSSKKPAESGFFVRSDSTRRFTGNIIMQAIYCLLPLCALPVIREGSRVEMSTRGAMKRGNFFLNWKRSELT